MVTRKPIFANKEDANAREALQLYESKQYKKALKLVDQNLKKNPHHAELLALKGCCNHQLGHRAEAEPYIVRALAREPANYMVNHLAAIYYRSVEKYPEAARWYQAAVDNGLQNTPILRDLAVLQVQIRDYKGLRELRQQFLESQPGYRANWTAVAVAHHLNKDYDAAVSTLAKIEDIIREHLQEQDRCEQSECVLYKNLIIAEAGDFARALHELDADTAEIRDRTLFLEYRAKYLLLLGQRAEALREYRRLLQRNPDNAAYYHLLEAALETPQKGVDVRLRLYDKLARFYPRADPPQFLPLAFLPAGHPEFRVRAEKYIVAQLQRGVPATFVNVKPLYRNAKKAAVIADIVLAFFKSVAALPPPVYVWTCYFLSQHHLHLSDLAQAEHYVAAALDHSPTLVELYMLKARIAKHRGDHDAASDIMQEGRALDLQDRFINSKATKYLLRANKVEQAIDCISLFTKLDDGAVNGLKDLHTMQANWVLVGSGEAYARIYREHAAALLALPQDAPERPELADLTDMYRGLALKRFLAVVKVFQVYHLDQFDYHSYCVRRGTPRDYIDMLRWEDKLHGTPIYVRAVRGLMDIYWEVYEQQKEELAAEDPKAKKKKTKKPKPLNIKKKSELMAKVESVKEDADPFGLKLLSDMRENTQLLDEIETYVKQLTTEADKFRYAWELAYRFYKEAPKYVLALQAVRNWAKIVDPANAKLRVVGEKVVDLQEALEADTTANPAVVKVTQKGLESAFPGVAAGREQFLATYAQ